MNQSHYGHLASSHLHDIGSVRRPTDAMSIAGSSPTRRVTGERRYV